MAAEDSPRQNKGEDQRDDNIVNHQHRMVSKTKAPEMASNVWKH
jgi:hypothetical protein